MEDILIMKSLKLKPNLDNRRNRVLRRKMILKRAESSLDLSRSVKKFEIEDLFNLPIPIKKYNHKQLIPKTQTANIFKTSDNLINNSTNLVKTQSEFSINPNINQNFTYQMNSSLNRTQSTFIYNNPILKKKVINRPIIRVIFKKRK